MESSETLDYENLVELLCVKKVQGYFSVRKEKGETNRGQELLGWGQGDGKYKERVSERREIVDESPLECLLCSVQNNHPFLFYETFSEVNMAPRDLGSSFSFLRI